MGENNIDTNKAQFLYSTRRAIRLQIFIYFFFEIEKQIFKRKPVKCHIRFLQKYNFTHMAKPKLY